jgi:hypothetical protein
MQPTVVRTSRRWTQFSLRAVLVCVTACAVLAGFWAAYIQPYFQEQRILAEMQSKELAVTTEATGPRWLQSLAGGKFAQRVVRVDVGSDATDADLRRLVGFSHLHTVMIAKGPEVTDEGLAHLAKVSGLRALMLGRAQVSDEGLRHLRRAKNLRELWIGSDRITDDGLAAIGSLSELRLFAVEANVTDEGMRRLTSLTKLETLRCLPLDRNLERARSVLSMPTDVDFAAVPLLDACEFLAQLHGATIRLDNKAFQAAGIDPRGVTVTGSSEGERFGSVLSSLLAPHGLALAVEPGGLVVTTVEMVRARRQGVISLQNKLPGLKVVEVWW